MSGMANPVPIRKQFAPEWEWISREARTDAVAAATPAEALDLAKSSGPPLLAQAGRIAH